MSTPELPAHAYALFEAKGSENSARVRRVVALVSAACRRREDWRGLRILDLGCGEGLFALEAALHGAEVVAIDAREERMAAGRALAAEMQLANVEFIHADVRSHPFEQHGPFDVVLCLGILYHLDAPALFDVVRRIANATRIAAIVETHVAHAADTTVHAAGETYRGWVYREHRAEDGPDVRRARLLASTSNTSSLWLTPASLVALLCRAGFPTILQAHAPLQPFEGADRVTLLALAGASPTVRTFPWINAASDHDVRDRSRPAGRLLFMPPYGTAREDVLLGVVMTLGAWVRAHPELTLGTRGPALGFDEQTRAPEAAIWRRQDLHAYVGRLRRVPPLLAVIVAEGTENAPRAEAIAYVASGIQTVWLVQSAARAVVVFNSAGAALIRADEVLPESPGLPGLRPRFVDFLAAPAPH